MHFITMIQDFTRLESSNSQISTDSTSPNSLKQSKLDESSGYLTKLVFLAQNSHFVFHTCFFAELQFRDKSTERISL